MPARMKTQFHSARGSRPRSSLKAGTSSKQLEAQADASRAPAGMTEEPAGSRTKRSVNATAPPSSAPASSTKTLTATELVKAQDNLVCRIKLCRNKFVKGTKQWGELVVVKLTNGKEEIVAVGDMCGDCLPVYKSRELEGTWLEVSDKVNSSQQSLGDWMLSVRYSKGQLIKPWHPGLVSSKRESGVAAQVKLRGTTPAQFVQIFTTSHDDLGYKCSLLPDLAGELCQGILLRDDGSLYR